MKVLGQIGFQWHENGAILNVTIDGETTQVFVPLSRLQLEFGEAMAGVGCPLAPTVGDMYTVSGLFRSIKKAAKRAARTAKSVRRATTGRVRRAVVRRVVPKAIRARAGRIRRMARRHVTKLRRRGLRYGKRALMSRTAQYAAPLLSAIPATAPAGAALLAAQNTMRVLDRANRAAQLAQRGLRRPRIMNDMAAGMAQRQAVNQLGNLARQGNPQAQQFFGALQQFAQ